MRNARQDWMTIVDKARTVEFQHIDQAVRNWLVFLGAYEVVIIIAAVISALALAGSQNGNWLLLLVVVIALWLAGLFVLPLRGAIMAQAYGRRMLGIEADLEKALN